MSPDELMAAAARYACQAVPPRRTKSGELATWPLESELEAALISGLVRSGVPRECIGARKKRIEHCWEPRPNGLDLYVWRPESPDELWFVAELKIDAPDQTLWDLFKLTASFRLPRVEAAYLVIPATASNWSAPGKCNELFPEVVGESVDHDSVALFRDNDKAWTNLLRGGSARPTCVPRRVRTESILPGHGLSSYPHLEMRVAAVSVADSDPLPFGSDGWPLRD